MNRFFLFDVSAGPVFFAAQLIGNLLIFWIVLGLESFTKEMQIGTYIVVIAVALLLRVGPGVQEDQVFEDLITKPWAAIWSLVLIVAMLISALPVIPGLYDLTNFSMWKRYAILLTVRSTAFAINLTTGRALILKAPREWIIISVVIKVLSGIIYTRAIVVQSTVVEQASFVPLNAVLTLFVNALTGIIIWEDWRVIGDWTGYVCVFLLFILGSGLLLGDMPLLSEADPEAFRAGFAVARGSGQRKLISRIMSYGGNEHEIVGASNPSFSTTGSNSERPTLQRAASHKEAWLSVFHMHHSEGSMTDSNRSIHAPPSSRAGSVIPQTILEENSDDVSGRSLYREHRSNSNTALSVDDSEESGLSTSDGQNVHRDNEQTSVPL